MASMLAPVCEARAPFGQLRGAPSRLESPRRSCAIACGSSRRSSPRCRSRLRLRWRLPPRARACATPASMRSRCGPTTPTTTCPTTIPTRCCARTRVDYPIRIDRLIGSGELPNARLQRAFGRPGRGAPTRSGAVDGPLGWFLVPHGTVRLPPAAPPRSVRARRGDDRGDLRPRPGRLLGDPDGSALVCRRERADCRRCGGSWSSPASGSGVVSGDRSTMGWRAIPSLPCRHFTLGHR